MMDNGALYEVGLSQHKYRMLTVSLLSVQWTQLTVEICIYVLLIANWLSGCFLLFFSCFAIRYYKTVPNLPERLQPECMVRLYGLRACVIRALYYMYPPFVNKVKAVTTFEGEPHNLTKRQCILMWYQVMQTQIKYKGKYKCPSLSLSLSQTHPTRACSLYLFSWSSVLKEKLVVTHWVKKFPAILET
jgi:hypothetical protein